ncbi:uncharacterized protein LOC143297683 [Babylonia areolata]|uniref:uncharacterized protein LOC143297683 n=1 Tax=Babylonia areolata TaxID=304850 RepID=UPI003FD00711
METVGSSYGRPTRDGCGAVVRFPPHDSNEAHKVPSTVLPDAASLSMRVASAHSARASQRSPLLSIDDVYKLAERTRMRTSLEARHLVLAQRQKTVVGRESVLASRSNTAAFRAPGHTVEGEREESAAPPPPGFVRNVRISFKPLLRPINNNNNNYNYCCCSSFVDCGTCSTDYKQGLLLSRSQTMPAGFSGSAPRGSESSRTEGREAGVCRDCRKLRAESVVSSRMQTGLPPLNLDEKHVTSSALVRRARPDLTPREIQEKLVAGEIATSALILPRRHGRHEKDDDDTKDEDEDEEEREDTHTTNDTPCDPESSKTTGQSHDTDSQGPHRADSHTTRHTPTPGDESSSPTQNPVALLGRLRVTFRNGGATTPLYFMDLRHMNSKIFHGRARRRLKVPGEGTQRTAKTDSRPLWPAFVSPRKCKLIEEPKYRAYFDPPLLAKRKQIPNPAFFAGSDHPYSLPERLPEELQFSGGSMDTIHPDPLLRPSPNSSPPSSFSSSSTTTKPHGSSTTAVAGGDRNTIQPTV